MPAFLLTMTAPVLAAEQEETIQKAVETLTAGDVDPLFEEEAQTGGTASITGGTVKNTNDQLSNGAGLYTSSAGAVTISGGTVSSPLGCGIQSAE